MLMYINLLFVYLIFFTRDSLLVYLNGFSLFVVFGLVVVTLASSLCHVTPTTTLSLMYEPLVSWFGFRYIEICKFQSFWICVFHIGEIGDDFKSDSFLRDWIYSDWLGMALICYFCHRKLLVFGLVTVLLARFVRCYQRSESRTRQLKYIFFQFSFTPDYASGAGLTLLIMILFQLYLYVSSACFFFFFYYIGLRFF